MRLGGGWIRQEKSLAPEREAMTKTHKEAANTKAPAPQSKDPAALEAFG